MDSDFDSEYDSECEYADPVIRKVDYSNRITKIYTEKDVVPWATDFSLTKSKDPDPEPVLKNDADVILDECLPKLQENVNKSGSLEELDKRTVSSFINVEDYPSGIKEIISGSRNYAGQPRFFLDICNILCGARCESLLPLFALNTFTLMELLTVSEEKFEELGVFPFQRQLIKDALYKFHKQPYHPSSLHVVPLEDPYSNIDVAVQVLTLIKQITAMEATLKYIIQNYNEEVLTNVEKIETMKNIVVIRKRLRLCRNITNYLHRKAQEWDKAVQPADLITKYSKTHSKWTPNKIIVITLFLAVSYKLWKWCK